MLRHPLVASAGDSCLDVDLGRSDSLHQGGKPGISTGRLQTILFSAHNGQQTDWITSFPFGSDSVLVRDSYRYCSGYRHLCRRAGGAFYQNEELRYL